jgi:hypothetical protein
MDEGVGVLDQGVVEALELGYDLAGVQCDGKPETNGCSPRGFLVGSSPHLRR